MSTRYVLRPQADQDLDQQAYYLATEAGPETGHRFLVGLLAKPSPCSRPSPRRGWPLRLRNPRLASLRVFRISGFEKVLVLYLPVSSYPVSSGVEIVRVIHGSRDLVAFLRRERLQNAFHRSPTNVRAATTLMAARPDNHTVLRLPVITAAESWWWSSSHYAPVGSSL